MGIGFHLAVGDVEIDAGHELAIGTRCDQQRVIDDDRLRDRVVRMACQDDVDAIDAACELAVDVETVVRKEHDDVGAGFPRFVHMGGNILLADAE